MKTKIIAFLFLISPTLVGCNLKFGKPPEKEINKEIASVDSKRIAAVPEQEVLIDAMNTYDSGLYSVSKDYWQKVKNEYPGSYFSVLADLKTADALFYSASYDEAVTAYDSFLREHRGHEASVYAMFQIASAYIRKYRDAKRDQGPLLHAVEVLDELIRRYPDNEYSILSFQMIKVAREFLAEHEAEVARFYFKKGDISASAARYANIVREFSDTEIRKEIAAEVEADDELNKETRTEISQNRPNLLKISKGLQERISKADKLANPAKTQSTKTQSDRLKGMLNSQ